MTIKKIAEATDGKCTIRASAEVGASKVTFTATQGVGVPMSVTLSVKDFKEFIGQLMSMKPYVKENYLEA